MKARFWGLPGTKYRQLLVQASEDSPPLLPKTWTEKGVQKAYEPEVVKIFQRALNALKAKTIPPNRLEVSLPLFPELGVMPTAPVSGFVDPATVASITAFQNIYKLLTKSSLDAEPRADGIAGHQVFKKMDEMLFLAGL
jgi:hypothetical protein